MYIHTKETPRGYSLQISGAYAAEPCELRFPGEVWAAFPLREAMLHEAAYFTTMATALILGHPRVQYNTREPRYFDFYNRSFELFIPSMVDLIPREDSGEVLARFRSISRTFSGPPLKAGMEKLETWNPRKVVLPFSFGNDSLLSLATLRALGYDVVPVYIDERMHPRGFAIRKALKEKLESERGLVCHLVENEIQLLSDFQVLGRPQTQLYQVSAYFMYLFAMLPFSSHFHAPFIVFNNEYHHSLKRVNREGYILEHEMQGPEMTAKLARVAGELSRGQIALVNLIGGMGNFAIHRILHEEFPDLGRYRVTCDMEMSDHAIWCHDCEYCAQAFIFFLASGNDPFQSGFEESMLAEDKKEHYSLFKESVHPEDEYHPFACDEEALAFYMASERGAGGPLMDLFRKRHLKKTKKRLAELQRKVFSLHAEPGKENLVRDAHKLYETFLEKYRAT